MLLTVCILLAAFVIVVMVAQTVMSRLFSAGERRGRVNRRLALLDSGMSRDEVYHELMRSRPDVGLATVAPKLNESASLFYAQTGLRISPVSFTIYTIVAAVALWAASMAFLVNVVGQKISPLNVVISMLGALVLASVGGGFVLSFLRARRLRKIEEMLPMALDIIVRAVRAGHPVVMAVKLASEEMRDPIGSEFGLIVDETTYGVEFRQALVNLAKRTGSPYAHFFAVSVAIQSDTGGNLAEILGTLAATIRSQQTLHMRVKALASEGKMSAIVLSVLPIGLIAWLMMTQPTFYTSKASDPIFWPAVGGVTLLYLLGQLMIRQIINFKY
jgi:tight adherence protein B